MTSPAEPTPTAAAPRRRGGIWKWALYAVSALLILTMVAIVFVVEFISLQYDGPEPLVRVQPQGFAPEAIATEGVAVSPAGIVHFADGQGFIYQLREDGSATVFADLRNVPPTEEPAAICQIAFAPTGDLYVAHFGRHAFHRISPAGELTTLDTDLQGPNFVLWHPAGYVFLTDSSANVLYRYDPDGGNRTVIATGVSYPNGFALSSDGRTILLNSCDTGRIYRIPLTERYEAAGAPEEVRFLGMGFWHKAILDGMLRLSDGTFLVCDFFGHQLIRLHGDGTVVQRIVLGEALNGKPIYPASLAETADGAVYVTNLGNVFTKAWGRGVYRVELPSLPVAE